MPTNRPDPGEFLEMAQRMLRELFTNNRADDEEDDEPWSQATRSAYSTSSTRESRERGPSAERQRENLTFALATRAVEALEDLALNVAAIRQRLERTGSEGPRPDAAPSAGDAAGDGPPTG